MNTVFGPIPDPYISFVHLARHDEAILSIIEEKPLPRTLAEAFAAPSPENRKWAGAAMEAYESFLKQGVGRLVVINKDEKCITTKLVFKIKKNANGESIRYHVRPTARGCQQTPGVNVYDTYSPVANFGAIMLYLGICCKLGYRSYHLDVSSAFYFGESIEKDNLFIELPEKFIEFLRVRDPTAGKDVQEMKDKMLSKFNVLSAKLGKDQRIVLHLIKGMPGSKQANRAWSNAVDSRVRSLGFKRTKTEGCLYLRRATTGLTVAVVFVDDFQVAGPDAKWLHDQLNSGDTPWPVRGEPLSHFLGIKFEFAEDARSVRLTQGAFTRTVIEKFGSPGMKPLSIPMKADLRLVPAQSEDEIVDFPMDAFCGSLLWLGRMTRPDILHPVTQLCRFVAKPTAAHVEAGHQLLRYLVGTIDQGISFDADSPMPDLFCFSDAEFASIDLEQRRSCAGHVVYYCGGPVIVRSGSESRTAGSTAVAEYYSLARCGESILFARHLLEEIGFGEDGASIIYVDNQTAMSIGNRDCKTKHTKHVEVKYHMIQDMVERNEVRLIYCPTSLMVADILTKPLAKPTFLMLSKILRGDIPELLLRARDGGKLELFLDK